MTQPSLPFPESCDILFTHANLATMAGKGFGIMEQAALAVSGTCIAWTGPMAALPQGAETRAREIIDCRGKWLLPGFVDCHTHLIWGGSRSQEFEMRLSGVDYETIARKGGGIVSTVNATRAASEDELFRMASHRADSLLHQGVTCFEVKSGYGLDLANELKMLACAGRLAQHRAQDVHATFLGAHALPPEYAGRAGDYVDFIIREMLPRVKDQGIATAVDAFCETIAFSREQTQKIFQAATDLGFRVKLHAEQLSDCGGAAMAAQFNSLSCDHLEYLSGDSARAMADNGVAAVLLPGAFHYLKETRVPPVSLLRDLGIPMALSTDLNPGTSPVFAMMPVLNMGCILFGLTCEEAIAGATINGARALGVDHCKGSLEPGKDADLALWDISRPADLCYITGHTPLERVVISGRTAYENPLAAGPVT